MKLSDLFKQLRARRVVAESNKKDRAAIEYSVILTVAEYEELEKEAKEKSCSATTGAAKTFDTTMMNSEEVKRFKKMLYHPDSDASRTAALHQIGEWVISTCLLFGTDLSTAYKVAAAFVEGLENSYRKTDDIEKGN